VTATLEHIAQEPGQLTPPPYSKKLLFGGTVGRIWLWFVAGCLAVTIIPMLFGWRPYVIQSGSMQPRIKVGDIVIASPNHDPKILLGHVTVFHDPDFPDRMKTHRVIKINKDGRLVTKGDANPTADSQPVRLDRVVGIGRLMVRWAGLPLVWAHTGKWLYLLLFVFSLYLSALVVARDREPYEYEEDERGADKSDPANDDPTSDDPTSDDPTSDDHGDDDGDVPEAGAVPRQRHEMRVLLGVDRRKLRRAGRRVALRSTALLAVVAMLALPTAHAAFAAITKNTADTWSVPNWNYTNEAKALGPYIYYKLDDATASANATDVSGNNFTGTYTGTSTNYLYQQGGAFTTDTPDTGVTQRNNNACIYSPAASGVATSGPATYSEIVWFKSSTAAYNLGGKLVGFETGQSTLSDSNNGGQYDRHVYMDGNGHLWFGVWLTASGAVKTITAATDYADANWHMAVATMGAGGMRLYVDGVLQASDANTISETFLKTGYWRFGCGNLSGWGGATTWTGANAPTTQANVAFQGSLDEVAIYNSQLTATQISFLYSAR
jgi:signal peptidase I